MVSIELREQFLYRNLQSLLNQLDVSLPLTAQSDLLQRIADFNEQMGLVFKQEASHHQAIFNARGAVPVYRYCADTHTLCTISDEFYFFIDNLLDLKNLEKEDVKCIHSQLFKLMTRPAGQHLIMKLNQYYRSDNAIRITFNYGSSLKVSITDAQAINLSYPKAFHEQNMEITAAEAGKITFMPCFVSLGHELVHVYHLVSGQLKRSKPFPAHISTAKFHLYWNAFFADAEELSTIEDLETSENAIRREHQLYLRKGHLSATLNNQTKFSLLVLLTRMREGYTDFRNLYLPDGFKPNPLLDISSCIMKSEGIKSIPIERQCLVM